jgi:PAS domain S-box-containing protein
LKTAGRPRSLRSHLTTLVFASVVPVLIFAVVIAVLFERHERAALERGLRDTTQALTASVDHELIASISTLRALATSEHLDTGDLRAFYEQAQRVLKSHQGWNTINLSDLSGQQLLNLFRPFGAPLPNSGNLPVIRHTLDTGEPSISDLMYGPVSKAPIIGITVPVMREGALQYVLGAGLDVAALNLLLSESKLPPEWNATILDRQGIILARTHGIGQWLGKPAAPTLVTQSRPSEEGAFRTTRRDDGVAAYGAYARSRLSGWTVSLTVPAAVVEAPARITLLGVLGGGIVFLLLAGALSAVSVRRITRAIASLSAAARDLGQGNVTTMARPTKISEVNDVAQQMAEAALNRAAAIAAREKTEAVQREAAAIVESSEDAIIGKTLDGTIVTWNRGAMKLYGYPAREMVGRSISTLVPSDRPDEIPSLLDRLKRGEVIEHYETVRARRDGTLIDVSVTLSPIKDATDTITGASSIARDITQRKRAEETGRVLAEVGRKLTGTLDIDEAAGQIVSAILGLFKARRSALFELESASGSLVCVAVAGERDPANWVGQRFGPGEGVVGRAVAERRPVWTSDLLADPRIVVPPWVRERARETGYAGVAAVPLTIQGEVIGALSISDADRRVFTDEEVGLLSAFGDQTALALQNARLLSTSNRRRHEAEALSEIGRTISQSLDVKEVAQGIADSVHALFSAENAAVFRLEPESQDLITVAAAGNVGQTDPMSITFPGGTGVVGLAVRTRQAVSTVDLLADPRVTLEAGARARIEQSPYRAVLAAPLIVTDRVIGALGIGASPGRVFSSEEVRLAEAFADQAATALENARLYQATQQAYEDLKRTQDQLIQAQKMESVGRLAGGISHDFNNLLTVIAGRAQLAMRHFEPDSQMHRDLETITGATERATALTRQLLAFGRKQVLQAQVLDLHVVVEGINRLLSRTIGEDITIRTVTAPDLGRVKADPTQVEQVIMNLVVNARDAMPEGGQLTIETSNVELDETYARTHVEVRPGLYVMLAVTDTGMGMDRDTQARIFEPFFTTKEPGKGTGLGLATVYGIVKQSGGHLSVYSEQGRGTTFKIYLARVDEPIPSALPEGVRETSGGSETILLIEDEEEVRDLAKEILEASGYRVLVACHAAEALPIVKSHDGIIHLVVTDVVMPQMSGPELAERIKTLRPNLRVLYMSGYADNAIVQHGVLEAGLAFLQKPFTPDALVRKVREALRMPRSTIRR